MGSFAAVLSASGVARSLTGPGVIIGAALGGLAALLGVASAILTDASKKLGFKVTKHEKIHSLAISKCTSIHDLVSNALNDNSITDREFQLISTELEQYFNLKESMRTKVPHKQPKQSPDLNELGKKIPSEVREELQKRF